MVANDMARPALGTGDEHGALMVALPRDPVEGAASARPAGEGQLVDALFGRHVQPRRRVRGVGRRVALVGFGCGVGV